MLRTVKRIVYLGSGGLQGAARESALKVLEPTAGKLAAFYDSRPDSVMARNRWSITKRWWWCLSPATPLTRQYDLDLLAEPRRDNQAMRVIAIAAESNDVIAAGHTYHPAAVPSLLSTLSRHFAS